jgi:hypothetical protein
MDQFGESPWMKISVSSEGNLAAASRVGIGRFANDVASLHEREYLHGMTSSILAFIT